MERMGIDVHVPAVDRLYGQAAQAALLSASRHRLPLLTPASADDFTTSQFDGVIDVEGRSGPISVPKATTRRSRRRNSAFAAVRMSSSPASLHMRS